MDEFEDNVQDLQELLNKYAALKKGERIFFIDSEEFATIIDFFDYMGQEKEAELAINIGLQRFPQSSILLIKKADIEIAKENYQEALEVLEKATIFNPHDIQLYLLKMEALFALCNDEQAEQIFTEAVTKFEADELLNFLLDASIILKNYQKIEYAFDCLKLVLELEPTHKDALRDIYELIEWLDRNEDGIILYQRAIDKDPYNTFAWLGLAVSYQHLKLYEKAIESYLYALAIDDKNILAHRELAICYMKIRQYEAAIDILLSLEQLHVARSSDLELLGDCYTKIHLPAKARVYYAKVYQQRQENKDVLLKLAQTYMKEQEWRQSIALLLPATQQSQCKPKLLLAMAECQLAIENIEEAALLASRVLHQKPNNYAAWKMLLLVLYTAQQFDNVAAFSIAAFEMTGGKGIFLYYQALANYRLGKTKQAIVQLQQAMMYNKKVLKKAMAIDRTFWEDARVKSIVQHHC